MVQIIPVQLTLKATLGNLVEFSCSLHSFGPLSDLKAGENSRTIRKHAMSKIYRDETTTVVMISNNYVVLVTVVFATASRRSPTGWQNVSVTNVLIEIYRQ